MRDLISLVEERLTFNERFMELREFILSQFHTESFSDDEIKSVIALLGKIEHMVFAIGCPNSVEPMLRSICDRKVKRWLGVNLDFNKNKKGKQLKSKDELSMTKEGGILVGHFRWNDRGYVLTRNVTNLLQKLIFS